jgi:hypothetical protein
MVRPVYPLSFGLLSFKFQAKFPINLNMQTIRNRFQTVLLGICRSIYANYKMYVSLSVSLPVCLLVSLTVAKVVNSISRLKSFT